MTSVKEQIKYLKALCQRKDKTDWDCGYLAALMKIEEILGYND